MRTYYELDDHEGFEAGQDLLIRRFVGWAEAQDREVEEYAVAAALGFRHTSVDGRLAYWTSALVRDFLLTHVPRALSATADEAVLVPETLRLFLRYLYETALADPLGEPLADLEAAVAKAAAEFPAAMADERNFGVSKFWVMTAVRNGVDRADPGALNAFVAEVREGRADYDAELFDHIVARQLAEQAESPGRAIAQLPVALPPDDELLDAAERSSLVIQLRKLVEWVGDGRALTGTGTLKIADARALVPLLDTGDQLERRIGDDVQSVRTSADLPGLTMLAELAKHTRIVRVVKGKLVRVAKAARLVADALALWTAAFDAIPELDPPVRSGRLVPGYREILDSCLDVVLPDVLNTIYGLPEPMPVIRLVESSWEACLELIDLDLEPSIEDIWRDGFAGEFRRLLGKLAEFGAVELTAGPADPIYTMDLGHEESLLSPEIQNRLRVALAAPSVDQVALTPLATRAVRARMLRQGRYVPLVGELATAAPGPMLGMLTEHFTDDTAAAEITGWLASHGGWDAGLPLLLDAIRETPFRTRAAAMLDVLAAALPDRREFLRSLRIDPTLGPIVTQLLVNDGELDMESLDEQESLLGMAEQFLAMLETGGPDATAAVMAEIPGEERVHLAEAISASGHPDEVGLAELAGVFDQTKPPNVHPLRGVTRVKSKKRRR